MARVALLVTVLAALCYTSQAIPVPIENAEGTQPNIMQQIRDEFKDFMAKIMECIKKFEKELQEEKKFAASNFDEYIENLKKLFQEKKQDANEIYEKIKIVKGETLRDFQNVLKDGIKKIEDYIKGGKEKLKEKLDLMTEGKAKEILELLGKGRNGDETYGIGNILEKSKGITNGIKDKLMEELKNKGKTEAMKGFGEKLNELKKLVDVLNNEMDQAVDKFKETMEKVGEKLGDRIGKVKDEAEGKLEELKKKLKNESSVMKDRMNNGFEKLREKVETGTKELKALMSDLTKIIVSGDVKNKIGKLTEILENQTGKLKEKLKEAKDAFGKMFENLQDLPGMIEDSLKEVQDKTSDMIGGATNKINEKTDILAGKLIGGIKQGGEALKNTKEKIMKPQQAALIPKLLKDITGMVCNIMKNLFIN